MKSFCAKLSFKITNKKNRSKNGEIQGGVQMTPPLGLRVTIFSLGLLGLKSGALKIKKERTRENIRV